MAVKLDTIQSVVFSGGGARCVWQSGFWEVVSEHRDFSPTVLGCASAGATMACIALSGRGDFGLDYFKRITDRNRKNVYPEHLFKTDPVFPHYRIYRQAILDIFDGAALQRLHDGPEIRVQISRPPRFLGARSGTVVGIAAYALEKKLCYPMHPTWPSRIGFTPEVIRVSDCTTIEELADLLLQSSCTPPFVPVMKRDGRPTLDGGLIDNVPVALLDDQPAEKLILLSRQYPMDRIPEIPGRHYLQPSQPITVSKWDYTSPEGLQKAYDLGRIDGEAFLDHL